MSEPFSPVGALETLIIAKESQFGVKASMGSGIGQAFNSFPPGITIQAVPRSPRGSLSMPVPGPGGRSLSSSLDVETTSDTIGQILAYGLGRQTITAASHIYSGTLQASASIGDMTMKLTANILFTPALLFPGMQLDVDTSTNKETVTISSVNWSGAGVPGAGFILVGFYIGTPGNGFTKTHTSSTVVVGTATTAMNVITPGSPLPTFTAQTNRPGGVATNKLGCKIDQLALSFKTKAGLTCKASICIRDEQEDGSPTAATLSSKNPYIYEQLFVPPTFGGKALSNGSNSSLRTLDITGANNLLKDNFVAGAGNLVYNWPEQLRSFSGSAMMGFETDDELQQFQTNSGGGPFGFTDLTLPLQGIDTIGGTGIPWFLVLYFPKVSITKWTATDDTSKEITQSLTLSFGDSTPGAGDVIQVYAPQVGSSAF